MNQKRGWMTILAFLAVGAACSPQAVAPMDGGEIDAASDVGELVDESDGGVTDAVVDAPSDAIEDVAITDAMPDSPKVDAADADASPDVDVPYWIAHDIDIAGLGVLTATGECSDPMMLVNPGDPPKGPACGSQCPPPYPCTCGVCPWIQTPKLVKPREGAAAIWTGKEVLVFGGANSGCCGGAFTTEKKWPFTAERWDPFGKKGFELIPLPADLTASALPWQVEPWVRAFWTGKLAVVLCDKPFTFNPETNAVVFLDPSGISNGEAVRVADQIFWWGVDSGTISIDDTKESPVLKLLDLKTMKWSDVAFPSNFLGQKQQWFHPFAYCITSSGSKIYVLDAPWEFKKGTLPQPSAGSILGYDLVEAKWTLLTQPPASAPRCDGKAAHGLDSGLHFFAAFPDGISIYGITKCIYHPETALFDCSNSGATYWSAKKSWSGIATGPAIGVLHGRNETILAGNRIVVPSAYYTDPVFPDAVTEGLPFAPLAYNPYSNAWEYLTNMGSFRYQRAMEAVVYTGSELLILGGQNGQGVGVAATAATGARLWLPANPTSTDYSGVLP